MTLLVVGGGGREHAIIKALKRNPQVTEIFALPGNGGIAKDATCVPIGATEIEKIVAFAREQAVDYAVVAPDDPLVLGCVDALNAVGISTTITTMSMAEMQVKLSAGSFDLALVSFAMDVCPDPGFLLMSGNTGNYGRYRSETMTSLCKELRKQTTQEGFRQTLMSIQQQFAEDCPFICLYYRSGSVLTRQMYTTARDVRELELLRGIESFHP